MLQGLTAEIDRLCEADPAVLADAETIEALHRLRDRVDAVVTRASAAFDAAGDWAPDGALSAAAWIATVSLMPVPAARREVGLGRAVRSMPVVEAAWLAGEINDRHVAALAAARTSSSEEAFARDEKALVDEARTMRFRHFRTRLANWRLAEDRERVEDEARAQRDGRRVHLSESFQGEWFLDGTFDPIGGTIVHNELERLERRLFEADWAEAKERLGHEPTVFDLGRSAAQRRADAMVEMAMRSGAVAPGARMPRPLFTVLVGYETFAGTMCRLEGDTVVTPRSLASWLADADVERIVFDGPSRVIDVGDAPALLHRRHPPGRRGTRPRVLPPVLRGRHRRLPGRPHRAERRRRAHRPGQRPPRLRQAQPGPKPTKLATALGGGGGARRSQSPVPALDADPASSPSWPQCRSCPRARCRRAARDDRRRIVA